MYQPFCFLLACFQSFLLHNSLYIAMKLRGRVNERASLREWKRKVKQCQLNWSKRKKLCKNFHLNDEWMGNKCNREYLFLGKYNIKTIKLTTYHERFQLVRMENCLSLGVAIDWINGIFHCIIFLHVDFFPPFLLLIYRLSIYSFFLPPLRLCKYQYSCTRMSTDIDLYVQHIDMFIHLFG